MRLTHIENRIEQQLTFMKIIANAFNNLIKVGHSQITPQRIRTRISDLRDYWEKFTIFHEAIIIAVSVLNSSDKINIQSRPYFVNNLFSETHECYLETLEKMNSLLDSDQPAITRTMSTETMSNSGSLPSFFHHTRLPRINIPKFDGSPTDWLFFKDLFTSIVLLNPTLTSVEKLQYLKTRLVGSAAHVIKNTALTADNFQKAWDALMSFYENKRLLVNAALHSLIQYKRMTKESATEMEQLYTSMMQIYRTLEALQRPVSTWDDFLVFITVQKLDSESVRAWEQHLGSSKESPTWNQFNDFLMTRCSLYKLLRSLARENRRHNLVPLPQKCIFKEKSKTVRQKKKILVRYAP